MISANKFLHFDAFGILAFIFLILAAIFLGHLISSSIIITGLFFALIAAIFLFITRPQLALFLFGCFMLLQNVLISATGIGAIINFDELIVLLFFIVIVFRKILTKESFNITPIDFPLLGVILIGLASNAINKSVSTFVTVSSLYLFIKGFILFYIFANTHFDVKGIKFFLKGFLIVGLFFALSGLLGFLFPEILGGILGINTESRLGYIPAQSLFRHPGFFRSFMAVLTCYSVPFYLVKKQKRYLYLSVFFAICTVFSFRRTSLLGVALAPLICAAYVSAKGMYYKLKGVKSYLITMVILLLILSGFVMGIFNELVQDYFLIRDSPRELLTKAGVSIFLDNFPLGSGFGTFGSWMSRVDYSSLYYKYGLNRIWGLAPGGSGFANDVFWPSILAEIGIFGLLCYVMIIIGFFRICMRAMSMPWPPTLQILALGSFMVLVESLIESTKGVYYEMTLWTYLYFGGIAILWAIMSQKTFSRHTCLSQDQLS